MRRSTLIVFLILLVINTGCNAFVDDETTPRITPAPVPSETPTITRWGIENPQALLDAHTNVLRTNSYTLHRNTTIHYANDTLRKKVLVDAKLTANKSRYLFAFNKSGRALRGPVERAAFWSNGEIVRVAQLRNRSTQYRVLRDSMKEPADPRTVLVRITNDYHNLPIILSISNLTTMERVDGSENESLYRIHSTDVSHPSELVSMSWSDRIKNVTVDSYTFNARVDSHGLIHHYRLEYTATVNGTPVHVITTMRITNVGSTSVNAPTWISNVGDSMRNALNHGT